MFGNVFGFLKGGAGGAGGAAAGASGGGGGMGGLAGFGDKLKNFGVSSDMRAQMGEDAFKKFRSDQMWNMGAALQGRDGGRDPSQHMPTAQAAMQNLDMNTMPYQMGQGGMMGMGLRRPQRRGGGLLDTGGY